MTDPMLAASLAIIAMTRELETLNLSIEVQRKTIEAIVEFLSTGLRTPLFGVIKGGKDAES